MKDQRVGVIMGGASAEREISLRSGEAIVAALTDRGYNVVPVVLGPTQDTAQLLKNAQIDVAVLALHGRYGEDGCIQGLCELYGIPYTGSSVLSSALAMHKRKAKELFQLHNVPTPPYYVVADEEQLTQLEDVHGSFGFPAIVKPCSEGSSIGVTKVNNLVELKQALASALELDNEVLVERYIAAKEVNVAILNGRVLGAVEIAPKSGLYDYAAKYTPGLTEYHLPARISATRQRGVLNLAERAAQALSCSGAVRVDLLVTEGENEYVLEVNTLPGMTETSLLPKIAEAAGFDFASLCERLVTGARLHNAPPSQRRRRGQRPTLQSGVSLTPGLAQAVGQ